MKRFAGALFLFTLAALTINLWNPVFARAQTPQEQETTLNAATRTAVIETTLKLLNENYVFPEIAKNIDMVIRQRLKKKEYDRITNPATLAELLTSQLQEISHDKHMSVSYSRKPQPPPSNSSETPQEKKSDATLPP